MPGGCGDEEYLTIYSEILVPVAKRFQPQLILASAGYDPHWSDPLSSMRLSTTGFVQIAMIIKRLADELCKGQLVFTLEGGYDLRAISESIRATIEMLLGKAEIDDPLGQAPPAWRTVGLDPLLARVKEMHGLT
jgi:acetoin utilization deacetylase AcuC-like enzyme